jgi:small subunit ribosomal protein S7
LAITHPGAKGACEIQVAPCSFFPQSKKAENESQPEEARTPETGTPNEKIAEPIDTLRRHAMPRRKKSLRRPEVPDAKYRNKNVTRFVSKLMYDGKRSLAERILYDAMEAIETKQRRPAIDVFEQALRNAKPSIEVKPRRVGGSTYQVPIDVRTDRGVALAMRWLIRAARSRTGRTMADKLANELMDAAAGQGATIKKREETHKMAESNKAFAHYRW